MARQDLSALALVAALLMVSSMMLPPTASAGMTEAIPADMLVAALKPKGSSNEAGRRLKPKDEAATLPSKLPAQENGFDDHPLVPKPGTTGRKLNQVWPKGSLKQCSYTLINKCVTKDPMQAVFAYPVPEGGYTITGWYTIKYGQTKTFTGNVGLYVYTDTFQRPTLYIDDEGEFCVSTKPFTFRADARGTTVKYYLPKCDKKGKCSGWNNAGSSCYSIPGYGDADYVDNFWPPLFCGMTVTYTLC